MISSFKHLQWVGIFFILSLSFYCAYKVAPSGGPEDKTPPEIVTFFPSKDSVGIKSLSFIEIEFSESVRKTTLPGHYWIIPGLQSDLEVKWKGSKKVRFHIQDSLEENQIPVAAP